MTKLRIVTRHIYKISLILQNTAVLFGYTSLESNDYFALLAQVEPAVIQIKGSTSVGYYSTEFLLSKRRKPLFTKLVK